jgi:hypothetical protein
VAVNIANSLSSREVSASGAGHTEEDSQRLSLYNIFFTRIFATSESMRIHKPD